jgi:hypothetical protein
MLPNEYDLQVVESRYRELRREAVTYRLAQSSQVTLAARPSLLDQLRAVASRLRLMRSVPNRAEAAA